MADESLLGTDYGWLEDVDDERMGIAKSPSYAFCESLARRLLVKKGSVKYWPNYGEDMRQFLLSDEPDFVIASAAENELYQDERVETVYVTARRIEGTIELDIRVEATDGTFAFVLSVSEAAAKLSVKEAG